LQPYAVASAKLALYDAGSSEGDNRLLIFKAEEYEPLDDVRSGSPLEGSVAAFEIPSCRFIGTLDYTRTVSFQEAILLAVLIAATWRR
jgi:hypothetical protein